MGSNLKRLGSFAQNSQVYSVVGEPLERLQANVKTPQRPLLSRR